MRASRTSRRIGSLLQAASQMGSAQRLQKLTQVNGGSPRHTIARFRVDDLAQFEHQCEGCAAGRKMQDACQHAVFQRIAIGAVEATGTRTA